MEGALPRIQQATVADVSRLARLFRLYPYKSNQQVVQRLDRDRLERFYVERLRQAIAAGRPHWFVEGSEEPLALAGLATDDWHGSVYGMKMGRVEPWLNTAQPSAGGSLLASVELAARDDKMDYLATRIDGADYPNLHLLEAVGWQLIGVSLKFSLPLPIQRRRATGYKQNRPLVVREIAAEDREAIRRLGSTAHTANHYLNDPRLAAEKTEELFAKWVDRCLDRLAYRVFGLYEPAGGLMGFVIYLSNKSFAQEVGREPLILDYVVLNPALRGGGIGPWFVEETLVRCQDQGFDFCELRTSGHNIQAISCYEKLAFRCCGTDFLMRKILE